MITAFIFTGVGSNTVVRILGANQKTGMGFSTGNNTPAQIGTYNITGTFTGTIQWEYSIDSQNWTPLAVWFGITGAPIQFSQPGYYKAICTAYTSGTPTITFDIQPYVYHQTLTSLGPVAIQVDDAGLSTSSFYYQNYNINTTPLINWRIGNKQTVIVNGTFALAFQNPQGPAQLQLLLKQDSVGYHTVFWPTYLKWPDAAETPVTGLPNSVDLMTLLWDGTYYYVTLVRNFLQP